MCWKNLAVLFGIISSWSVLFGAGSWQFSNGAEFKGATGKLATHDGTYLLEGDFSGGGSYVAMYQRIVKPEDLVLITFSTRGKANRIAVRFTDSDGQTHQHFLPLKGDGSWEVSSVRVAGSPEHHWGGHNDGVFRPPVRRVSIVTHRGDYPNTQKAHLEIRGIEFLRPEPPPPQGYSISLIPGKEPRAWSFSNGPEFPGATGSLEIVGMNSIRLHGDFSKGGNYVALWHYFQKPLDLSAISFTVKTASKGIDLRLRDSDGQTHQHYITLSGNPDEIQKVTLPVTGSPEHHWGGCNDGVLRLPIRGFAFSFHHWLVEKKGVVEFSNIEIHTPDYRVARQVRFTPVSPEKLFRTTSDSSPVELQLSGKPDVPLEAVRRFFVRDYTGRVIFSGNTAEYDPEQNRLKLPAMRGYAGLLEYVIPALAFRVGVFQCDVTAEKPDEFFAVDSSFSWGHPLLDEGVIRSYCRILKKNGILWNRDRLSWSNIQPDEGEFLYRGNFALYRKIATEEGILTLDTFHDAPAWSKENLDPGKYGPNPFPNHLKKAGESWVEIIRHYHDTLKALEVWNEPDLGFGSYRPAEGVSSFTKAVSFAARQAGLDTRIIGGVFAYPWPGTAFQDAYIANGLLDTCDVMSYHSYAGIEAMEPTLAELRERELALRHPRAGIPIWITECGIPWKSSSGERAVLQEDVISAAGIVGKALELKALGAERYFAFEYKFYPEGAKNFGMMDANCTPMRSMASYAFAARFFAGTEYVGDLRGAKTKRARIFRRGDDALIFLWQPDGKFTLPAGVGGDVFAIDGRPLGRKSGTFKAYGQIAYVKLPMRELHGRIERDTPAMKYLNLARDFAAHAGPRKVAPVVFRAKLDVSDMTFNAFGYNVRNFRDTRFDVELQNCSDETQIVRPVLVVPAGVTILQDVPEELSLPPAGRKTIVFRVAMDPEVDPGKFRLIRVTDGNGKALPLAFSVRPWEMLEKVTPQLPNDSGRDEFKLATLLSADDWTDFSENSNWKSWQGGETEPNISARFRAFYDAEKLQIQVLVKDRSFHQPYSAERAWNGDSLQIAFQQRGKDGRPSRNWNEVTVAQTGKQGTIYGHKGNPAGLAKVSKLTFIRLEDSYYLYIVDFDAKEFRLNLSPGSKIGFTLLVNSNSGTGRDGFLSWGTGIAESKGPDAFNLLILK